MKSLIPDVQAIDSRIEQLKARKRRFDYTAEAGREAIEARSAFTATIGQKYAPERKSLTVEAAGWSGSRVNCA